MSNVLTPPRSRGSSPLDVLPDPGVAEGMNLDGAPHVIPQGQGRYVQDVLLDVPGIVRQRGPVRGLATGTNPDFPSMPTNARIIGMTTLADPNGTDSFRLLLLVADKNTAAVKAYVYGRTQSPAAQAFHARAFFELMEPLDATMQRFGDPFLYFDDRRSAFQLIGTLLTTLTIAGLSVQNSEPDPYFSSSMALDGGALIGIGTNFGADALKSSHRAMMHWRGAAKATYNTGTMNVTQSSKAVVGVGTTWVGNIEPGMFLLDAAGRRLGVVASVTDNTHLTLEQNATAVTAAGVAYSIVSIHRPYSAGSNLVSAGAITTATTSAVVNGGGTKFVDQGVANGNLVFKESDLTYIGTVNTIQSNSQLTLSANAAVAVASENYIITAAAPWAAGSEPAFATYFNGIQMLANADNSRSGQNERSRIFVTKARNLEGIDLTKTGTYYDLPSTKPHTDIRGLFATESAALVFLAEATYGLFGNDPAALVPKVIHNDGLLSPMTLQPWQAGCVWAGFRSLYYYDGAGVRDLLAGRAAAAHQKALAGLDYSKLRAWSMLHNGHYICFLSSVNSGVFSYTKGRQNSVTSAPITYDPTSIIYCINLRTGALQMWTNVAVRGYSAPPGKLVSLRDAYYVVESATTNGPIICSAESLFQEAGTTGFTNDAVMTNPRVSPYSPHFYIEGRLNSFGDAERAKRANTIMVQYSLYGSQTTSKLGIDLIRNMGELTKAVSPKDRTSTNVAAPISWANKRSRFSTKGTLLGVRFYTMDDGVEAAPRIGPVSIGFKLMRPGRLA